MGRGADRPALEPDLVAAAGPGRRRTDQRVLRSGGRGDRPDGRLLGARAASSSCAPTTHASVSFLALAPASSWPPLAFFVVQQTVGIPTSFDDPDPQTRFETLGQSGPVCDRGLIFVAIGVVVAWLSGRTIFAFKARRSAHPDVPGRRRPRCRPRSSSRPASAALRPRTAGSRRSTAGPGRSGAARAAQPERPVRCARPLIGPARLRSRPAGRGRVAALGLGVARRQRPAVPGLGRRVDDRPRRRRDLGADLRRCLRRRHRAAAGRACGALPDARPERLPVGLCPGSDQRSARQDHQLHRSSSRSCRLCRSPSARCSAAARRCPTDRRPSVVRPMPVCDGRLLPARDELAAPTQPGHQAAGAAVGALAAFLLPPLPCGPRRDRRRRRWLGRAARRAGPHAAHPGVLFASILLVNAFFFPGARRRSSSSARQP